jgi:hypothetical protein
LDKPRRVRVKVRQMCGVLVRPIRVPVKLEMPRPVRDERSKPRLRVRPGRAH